MKTKISSKILSLVLTTTTVIAMLFSSGCTDAGDMFARQLAELGTQQIIVSGVRNSIEGPRGTTVNVTPGTNIPLSRVNNSTQQRYYDGKMVDGSYYQGGILNNLPHGFGEYRWLDGQKYVGQFVQGKYQGYGKLTFPEGYKYVGQFKEDRPNGQGTFTSPNGTVYVGQFVQGEYNGIGKMTYPDGKVEEGLWRKGKFLGKRIE